MVVRIAGRWSLMLALLAGAVASACSTPVYRYALENWEADRYVLVAHLPKQVPADLRAALEELRKQENVNVVVRTAAAAGDEATLTLHFPHAPADHPAAVSLPATVANLKLMVDSPARAETAKRLLAGETAVFLFLDSGNAAKDKEVLARLEATIGDMEKNLQLPAQAPADTLVEGQQETADLRIDFSVVRVRKDDPKEKALIDVLLATEPDLHELKGPMVFPVFGRGRALYAIVDRGINAEILYEAGAFVTGACSCQVKAQNPGVDLPMTASWDSILKDVVYQEVELPPLTGITVADAEKEEETPATEVQEEAPACGAPGCVADPSSVGEPEGAPLEENKPEEGTPVGLFLAALGLVVLLGTAVVVVRSRRG